MDSSSLSQYSTPFSESLDQFEKTLKDANKPKDELQKKPVVLREWSTTQVELTLKDIEDLENVCLKRFGKSKNPKKTKQEKTQKMISISPCTKGENVYNVTPKNVIGLIELSNKVFIIQPKISVQNLLFLLCYCWDPSDWQSANFNFFKEMHDEKVEALLRAVAISFVKKVNLVIRQGILQGYQIKESCENTVRGGIRWNEQITRQFGRMPPVETTYEDITEDITENRIIKAATYALLKTRSLSSEIRQTLRRIDDRLDSVAFTQYSPKHLPEISYSAINQYYKPAIDLAKFILRNLAWTLQRGNFDAPTFLLYMPKVFEDFLVNALRETQALRSLGANPKNFPQNKAIRFDTKGVIEIKPDFTFWQDRECRIVGDCKYKRLKKKVKPNENLEPFEEDATGFTPDFYQLLTYTIATNLTSGMLIYADDGERSEENANIPLKFPDLQPRNTVTVLRRRAINLGVTPTAILKQLESIGEEIAITIKEQGQRSKKRKQEQTILDKINLTAKMRNTADDK